jgi:beta-lactamase superfamily II metal-dependent hydrolase
LNKRRRHVVTKALPEVTATILDVGHGNSAIVTTEHTTVVVDGGQSATMMEFLESMELHHVDLAIVSHADADHMAGVLALMSDSTFAIDMVRVNADIREGKLWEDFKVQAEDSGSRGTDVSTNLHRGASPLLSTDELLVEVLSPRIAAALTGAGGGLAGQLLTANRLSAVIRISVPGGRAIMLAADIDADGFEDLLDVDAEPRADVLVFPHHGGKPGDAVPFDFAQAVMKTVQPALVIFSNGRNRYDMPLPDIVGGVRGTDPNCYVACTQLATECAKDLKDDVSDAYLANTPSSGRDSGVCCAGSITLRLDLDEPLIAPTRAGHQAFIDAAAPQPMCRRVAAQQPVAFPVPPVGSPP